MTHVSGKVLGINLIVVENKTIAAIVHHNAAVESVDVLEENRAIDV